MGIPKNDDFLQTVGENFGRFGIKNDGGVSVAPSGAHVIPLYDSLHDTKYLAVAMEHSPSGKPADVWENVIKTDLIPALKIETEGEAVPAAALIVPSKDAEKVIDLCRSKGLEPSVYQLFPGYAVAGFSKDGVSALLKKFEKKDPEPENDRYKISTASDENEAQPNSASHSEPAEVIKNNVVEKDFKNKNSTAGSYKNGIGKKLAAAALLGVGLGLAAYAVKTASNGERPTMEEKPATEAVERYFRDLKNGFPENEELLKYLASNPRISEERLKKLANSPVSTEVIKNPSAPLTIIEKAASSPDESKRAAAAANPSASGEALKRLASDPSGRVRAALAKNPSIDLETMRKLAKDTREVRESLVENMEIPPDILDMATNGIPQGCELKRKLMANPCTAAASLSYNAANPDPCIRAGVAANPNTPGTELARLSSDRDPAVRSTAWKNPSLPPERLESAFENNQDRPASENGSTVTETDIKNALENPSLDPETIEKAVFTGVEGSAVGAAKNPSVPPELVEDLIKDSYGKGGLKKFINDAAAYKTPAGAAEILRDASRSGKPAGAILREKLSEGFIKNVYDPTEVSSRLKRYASYSKPPALSAKTTGENTPDRKLTSDKKDKTENPLNFENTEPSGSKSLRYSEETRTGGKASRDEEALKNQAAKTADSIIDGVMRDVLPYIESAANNKKSAAGDTTPSAAANAPAMAGANAGESARGSYEASDWMFKNACEELDDFGGMFEADYL